MTFLEITKIEDTIKGNNKDTIYLMSKILTTKFKDDEKSKELYNKISLFDKVKNYSDVCSILNTRILTIEDFSFLPENERLRALNFHKVKNIEKLFNGKWILNWKDSKQQKWYPYFTIGNNGLGFGGSLCHRDYSYGSVGYFLDEKTSDFVGKTFLDIYKGILE